jgi:hypothetical protein
MFGFAGNFEVENEHGGSIKIDYTTEHLLPQESLLVIINGKIVF